MGALRHLLVVAAVVAVVARASWRGGHRGYDRAGGTVLAEAKAARAAECHDRCASEEGACRSWRFAAAEGVCTLLADVPRALPAAHMVSGVSPSVYTLQPRAYKPLPVGYVTPTGWLLKQLQLQEEGLAGHLALFWPDVEESVWIGGTQDGDLHERTPYWLNGVTPLVYQLRNAEQAAARMAKLSDELCQEDVDMMNYDISDGRVSSTQECHDLCVADERCVGFVVNDCDPSAVHCWLKSYAGPTTAASCRCWGTVARTYPSLWNQTQQYLTYILTHQNASGWLGPDDAPTDGNSYWGTFDVLQAFTQWAEAEPSLFDKITGALLNFLLELQHRMNTVVPLQGWSAARWMDLELTVQWMLENAPQGEEQALWDLGEMAHDQGSDWEQWFQTFTGDAGNHGVNNAQALKSAAVWWRQSKNSTLLDMSVSRVHTMDDTYGVATGMFCADEVLCSAPEQKHPSRGTELCAVVEAMFSYATMFSVQGDILFADRAERIAFNALPATWASPRGGDVWNHQYLQATNELFAIHSDPHIWETDGPDSELYGLEPNFGCCTANFPQGWPKFAQNTVFASQDGGLAVGHYAPVRASLPDGSASVDIDTTYPFDSVIKISVESTKSIPLYLRIPEWADSASLTVDGAAAPAPEKGTMHKLSSVGPGITLVVLDLNPSVRLESWYPGAVSVFRGPLLFAVNLPGAYSLLATHAFDSCDYEVLPTTEWRFALNLDPSNLTDSLEYVQPGYVEGAAPFNHTGWPCFITAPGRVVANWGLYKNSAASPPPSPACTDNSACSSFETTLLLTPFGGTDLRMAQLPLAFHTVPPEVVQPHVG
eukprot:TRINITY_DN7815_c0_g1_i1.p1 TRINITY_DN7815_c0_g1~~TRINITY_DN7815_c0_g1_i1.p1  ORF type:complete len:825 (-),score=157.41 TRINITY_DN7815_c0_g1_i1:55-2529(-)